jgi:hypothetical protein
MIAALETPTAKRSELTGTARTAYAEAGMPTL